MITIQRKIFATRDIIGLICFHLREKCIETYKHSLNVSSYAAQLTSFVFPHNAEQITIAKVAGLLHDVGKIMINNSILHKSEQLSATEFEEMKRHTLYGAEYLKVFHEFGIYAAEVALHHHERWDGHGYPVGIKGTEIPFFARIICLADSLDAMESIRPYKDSFTTERIIEEIKYCSGKQFDPDLAQVLTTNILETRLKGEQRCAQKN
jgi:putative nucleotidyltransferase with HDIG domain